MATGNAENWESGTLNIMQNTMSFVATDHVGNLYNWFYNDFIVGQWLDANAFDLFKSDGQIFGFVSGIGYVAGIIALTFLTFGIGGVAVGASSTVMTGAITTVSSLIAGLAGFGEGTEYIWGQQKNSSMEGIKEMYINGEISKEQYDSIITIRSLTDEQWAEIEQDYKNGNITKEEYELMKQIREIPDDWKTIQNFLSGVGYGTAVGVWEGVQWYLDGKFSGATSAIRIGADSLFNLGDTPFRAFMESLMFGEDYEEAFRKQGGTDAMLQNFLIGLIGSTGGEIFDAHNANKLSNRLNNLSVLNDLDDATATKIRELLEGQDASNKININKMSDAELNQYISNLLSNRNSQIDEVAKYLYGDQSVEVSDQVMLKIANGVDAINRTGLLDNMDETKANSIRNQIMESYFSDEIDLSDINKTYINNLSNAYENEAIRQVVFENDYGKAAEYLFENTDAAYNKETFKETGESIFENLRQFLGDEEAAITTGRILENLIERRGGYVEIANIDGIKINTIKDIDWGNASMQLEDIRRMLNSLPQSLKETINEINISDLYNPLDQYWQIRYNNKNHISGMTGGNGSITIYTRGDFQGILHESGHCFDSLNLISSSKEWAASMEADSKINGNKMGVTDYADRAFNASGTRGEDFAESVSLYIINPDAFKKQYPNRWKILNELFN